MIKIQKASEVEEEFFFGRDFGQSIDTVRTVLSDIRTKKDAALHDYTARFDVSDPKEFEIPQSELKAAAEKLEQWNLQ